MTEVKQVRNIDSIIAAWNDKLEEAGVEKIELSVDDITEVEIALDNLRDELADWESSRC